MKFVLILALLVATPAGAETLKVAADVTFDAVGSPGIVKIHGESGKATGVVELKDGKASGSFDCAAAGFTTGLSLRDEHMKDKYLEVAKFPTIHLDLDPAAVASGDFPFTGKLTIKGVAHPVSGIARYGGKSMWAKFTTEIPAEVGVPSWLGVTVAKDVTVTVIGAVVP